MIHRSPQSSVWRLMEPCGLSGVVEEVPEGLQVFARRPEQIETGLEEVSGVLLKFGVPPCSSDGLQGVLVMCRSSPRRPRNRDSGGVSAVGTGSSC